MTNMGSEWSLSNLGPAVLLVWLEPWAEEFEIPARSIITLRNSQIPESSALAEIESAPDHIVVWANAPTIEVLIDGVLQKSGSASIPIPAGLTKETLNILFAGQPAARLGGAHPEAYEHLSWWKRIKRGFGL